jgi:hypothetical protein
MRLVVNNERTIAVKRLRDNPSEAWGYRRGRNFPSAELLIGPACTAEQAVAKFQSLGYTGVVLS